MVKTRKFIRKPLYVDAVQVTPEEFVAIALWCQGEIRYNDGEEVPEKENIDPSKQHIHVRVHNPKSARQTKAFPGDWILYTERGYKVYTQKAFKASFDPVVADDEPGGDEPGGEPQPQEVPPVPVEPSPVPDPTPEAPTPEEPPATERETNPSEEPTPDERATPAEPAQQA